MAEDIASLGIRITTNGAQQAVSSLSDVERQSKRTERAARDSVSAFDRVSGSLSGVSGAASAFSRVYGVLIGAFATSKIIEVADAFTNVSSRLNLATGSIEKAAVAQQQLFNISQQTRNSFTATADVFARFATSTQQLGISQDRLLGVTKTLNQAISLSGSSAQSAQAAMIQLGQGIAAGALRGEELNSVLEQTPAVARAIADGLGVPVGALKKLGEEGKLTAEMVIAALEKMSTKIDSDFSRTSATVGQALTQIGNSAGQLISTVDKATGATGALAKSMSDLSKAIDEVAKNPETAAQLKSISGVMGDFADRAKLTAQYMLDLFVTAQKLTTLPAFDALFGPSEKSLEAIRSRQAELNEQRKGAGFFGRGGIDRELSALKEAEDRALLNQALELEAIRRDKVTQKIVEQTKATAAETEGQKKARESYEKLIASIKLKTAEMSLELSGEQALSAGQKEALKVVMDLASGKSQYTAAQKRAITAALEENLATEKALELQKAYEKAQRDALDAKQKVLDEAFKGIDATIKEREQVEEQIKAVGKSKQELELLRAAKIEDAIATVEQRIAAESFGDANDELIAAYKKQIEELKKLKAARQGLAQTEAAEDLIERNKKIAEELQKDLERAFTDAFLRGSSISEAFKKSLKATVFKVTLQPVFEGLAKALAAEIIKTEALVDGKLGKGASGGIVAGTLASIGTVQEGFEKGFFAGLGSLSGAIQGGAAAFIFSKGNPLATAVGAAIGAEIGQFTGKLTDKLLAPIVDVLNKIPVVGDVLSFVGIGGSGKIPTRALTASETKPIADAIDQGYLAILQRLGGVAGDRTSSVFGTTGRNSADPQFRVDSRGFSSPVAEMQLNEGNLKDQVARVVFAELQLADFADNIDTFLDSIKPATATLKELEDALAFADKLNQLNLLFGNLEFGLKSLAGASQSTIESFLQSVGGLEGLGQRLGFFYDQFTSDEQKFQDNLTALNGLFASVGSTLPATRDQFSAYFKTLGPDAFAKVAPALEAIDAYYDAIEQTGVIAEEIGTASLAILEERKRLEEQLFDLTASASEQLAAQRNALDASNRALFDQVQAAKAVAEASRAAAEAEAQRASAILDERRGLEAELFDLSATAEQRLTAQRDALDESNRALFDQINALRQQQNATEQAAEAARQVAEEQAQRAAAVLAERTRLEGELFELTATSTQRLIAQRDALDASNRALFDNIQAVRAKQVVDQLEAEQLRAIAAERERLTSDLLSASLTPGELIASQRAALDESNRALFDQIQSVRSASQESERLSQAVETQQRATDQARQSIVNIFGSLQEQLRSFEQTVSQAESDLRRAFESQASELSDAANRFRAFAGSIKAFRDSLRLDFVKSGSAQFLGAQFDSVGERALAGDEQALGELQSSAQAFLDASNNSATDFVEYSRAYAKVQSVLAKAEGSSLSRASAAQQQLDRLQQLVAGQIDLASAVLSVEDAVRALSTARQDEILARQQIDALTMSLSAVGISISSVTAQFGGRIDGLTGQFSATVSQLNSALGQYGQQLQIQRSLEAQAAAQREAAAAAQRAAAEQARLLAEQQAAAQKAAEQAARLAAEEARAKAEASALEQARLIEEQKRIIAEQQLASQKAAEEARAKAEASAIEQARIIEEQKRVIAEQQLASQKAAEEAAKAQKEQADLQKKIAEDAARQQAELLASIAAQTASQQRLAAAIEAENKRAAAITQAESRLQSARQQLASEQARISALNTTPQVVGQVAAPTSGFSNSYENYEALFKQLSAIMSAAGSDRLTYSTAEAGSHNRAVSFATNDANYAFVVEGRELGTGIHINDHRLDTLVNGQADGSLINYGDRSIDIQIKRLTQSLSVAQQFFEAVALAEADLERAKTQQFATGGAFTNGVVMRPTMFKMGQMGEAGPEAIMPLGRGPDGSLGVRMMGNQGNAEMAREIRALREEVSMLRRENMAGQSAIAVNTGKAARVLERADNGESLNITMVTV